MSAERIPLTSAIQITVPFILSRYELACLHSDERKVMVCLQHHIWRQKIKDGRIRISDRVGSQWCTAAFKDEPYGNGRYGSTGRRCWQRGLQRLELRGWIARPRDENGERVIVLLFQFPAATPRTAKPGTAARPRPGSGPASAPTPHVAQHPPDSIEHQRAAAAAAIGRGAVYPALQKLMEAQAAPSSHEGEKAQKAEAARLRTLSILERRIAAQKAQQPEGTTTETDPGAPSQPSGP
jgi:hypothetical protein